MSPVLEWRVVGKHGASLWTTDRKLLTSWRDRRQRAGEHVHIEQRTTRPKLVHA